MSGLNGMVPRRKSNSSFMKACFECFTALLVNSYTTSMTELDV